VSMAVWVWTGGLGTRLDVGEMDEEGERWRMGRGREGERTYKAAVSYES
jgi:hypothetical protein